MNWLDPFLKKDNLKIAKVIEASYTDHLARLMEGKTTKYSSIEDALQDFATRLGLQGSDLDLFKQAALQKAASLTEAKDKTLEQLKEEGLLNSKAIEFMSKKKNKHTKDSPSPFVLDDAKGKNLLQQIEDNQISFDLESPGLETQTNEMSQATTGNVRLKLLIEKFAQKILDLKPSLENIESLRKELQSGRSLAEYTSSRYGFKFSPIGGKGVPQTKKLIEVTIYKFTINKERLYDFVNTKLRQQLEAELPFAQWIKFVEEKIQDQTLDGKTGRFLIDQLTYAEEDLFGTRKEKEWIKKELPKPTSTNQEEDSEKEEEIEEEPKEQKEESSPVVQLRNFLRLLPGSYQEKVLKMLAAGEYRMLHAKATGISSSLIYPSSYTVGKFVMMSSFAPYLTVGFNFSNQEQVVQVLSKIKELDKYSWKFEELKNLLEGFGVSTFEKPSTTDSEMVRLSPKLKKIEISNIANPDYKPYVLEKVPSDKMEQEKLLENLHDKMMSTIQENIPLAYAPTPEGGHRELRLSDFLESHEKGKALYDRYKKEHKVKRPEVRMLNLTQGKAFLPEHDSEVDNPNLGMHPSFRGQLKQPSSFGLPKAAPTSSPSQIESVEEKSSRISPESRQILEKLKSKEPSMPKAEVAPELPKAPSEPSKISPETSRLLDLLKKKKSTLQIFRKFAQVESFYMDEQGRRFSSEKEMGTALGKEIVENLESTIVEEVKSDLLSWVSSGSPIKDKVKKLPLAAQLKLQLLIKTSSPLAKKKLLKITGEIK